MWCKCCSFTHKGNSFGEFANQNLFFPKKHYFALVSKQNTIEFNQNPQWDQNIQPRGTTPKLVRKQWKFVQPLSPSSNKTKISPILPHLYLSQWKSNSPNGFQNQNLRWIEIKIKTESLKMNKINTNSLWSFHFCS